MGSSKSFPAAAAHPALRPLPRAAWVGSLLAWLGCGLCLVILQRDTGWHSFLCPAQGACQAVLGSAYADFRGIPLAWFGGAFYLSILLLWLAVIGLQTSRVRLGLLDVALWLILLAATFSAGLIYVQLVVLRAFCPLCMASALTVAALLAVTLQARRAFSRAPAEASPSAAIALGLFAALPALLFAGERRGEQPGAGRLWTIDLSTAHRAGPAEAPVQLVVFSDFQCSFCRQLAPVLQQLRAEFPQDVSILFRHYPLAAHPRAFSAAVAAECAGEQNAFWEYHDKLFAEGEDLSDGKFIQLATALGLDLTRFRQCLQEKQPRETVEANLQEASRLELPGTPMVFLNGRMVEDGLTRENLEKRIRDALRTAPSRGTPKPS